MNLLKNYNQQRASIFEPVEQFRILAYLSATQSSNASIRQSTSVERAADFSQLDTCRV